MNEKISLMSDQNLKGGTKSKFVNYVPSFENAVPSYLPRIYRDISFVSRGIQ